MKFALFGSGSFGTTMAVVLADNMKRNFPDSRILMYIRRDELFGELIKNRIHPSYADLRDVPIPENITFTESIAEALEDATHCVFAVPSRYSEDMLLKMKPYFNSSCKVVSLVKGFHFSGGKFYRISSLIKNVLNIEYDKICSLGGPNIYSEIASNYRRNDPMTMPCNAVVSSVSSDTAQDFQRIYYVKNILRTYTSSDIVAAEVCGALKNVIALASGLLDGYYNGMGFGINLKSSLITRALYEFGFFARALGASEEKVYGIAGLGDLIASCFCGRSYMAGRKLASGQKVQDVQADMKQYELEGLQTLKVVKSFLDSMHRDNPDVCLELPIIEGVYRIVYEDAEIRKEIHGMINRPLKSEFRQDPYISIS